MDELTRATEQELKKEAEPEQLALFSEDEHTQVRREPTGEDTAGFGPRLGSGRETFVAMMKSTDLREGNDLAWTRRPFRARLGTVFSERQVRPGSMVIVEVG